MNPSTQEGWGLLRRFGLGALGERVAKGSTWVFAARILSGVLGLAITAMLARQLPAAEFGAFMLALSVVTVCALIARFGMEQGGLQLISQQLGRGAEATAARTAIKILLFVTVSGGLIALALAFGAHAALAEHLFGSSALALLGIPVALWMLAFALQMLLAELFRGYGDVRMAAFLGGAVYGGALSSVLALVLIGGAAVIDARLDLRCAVLLVMMGNLASVVLGGILLLRRLKSAPRASSADIEVPSLARILAVGIPLLLVQVSFLVFGHADIWILAAFRSETEVGLYSAAARVAKFLGLVFLVVAEVIAPEIGRLHSRGERRKLEELLRISACFSTLPAILVFPLLLAVGDDLLALLFGELYRGAYPVLLS